MKTYNPKHANIYNTSPKYIKEKKLQIKKNKYTNLELCLEMIRALLGINKISRQNQKLSRWLDWHYKQTQLTSIKLFKSSKHVLHPVLCTRTACKTGQSLAGNRGRRGLNNQVEDVHWTSVIKFEISKEKTSGGEKNNTGDLQHSSK